MPVRHFNYTGRQRIHRDDVQVVVWNNDNHLYCNVSVDLSEYDLPKNASVSMEAYRQTSWMRFDCGKVKSNQELRNKVLTEFDCPDGVKFRFRVTSSGEPAALLLAEADAVKPLLRDEEEEERIPLLPVRPGEDLDEEVFRLNFDARPFLHVNPKIGDWRQVTRHPGFASLVYPSALRQVLDRIFYVEEHFHTSDIDDWRSQWLCFACSLPGIQDLPEEDAEEFKIDDWIDEVIRAFCKQFDIMTRFTEFWVGEE